MRHAEHHLQYDLRAGSLRLPQRHAEAGAASMIEALTATMLFVSIGVFLAHAYDALHMR